MTQIFFPFTFSCMYFITFYRCFQTQITPALCHWYTPAIELKLAGEGRWHFSFEWLRNSLAPTSNQPPKSVISSFPMSLTSASPSLLPLSLLWFRTQLPPAWAAAATPSSCFSYLWLLPLHSPQVPPVFSLFLSLPCSKTSRGSPLPKE